MSTSICSPLLIVLAMLLKIAASRTIITAYPSGLMRNDGECSLPVELIEEIQGYEDVVSNIFANIVDGVFKGEVHKSLETFTDKFGPRFAGSDALERSIDYIVNLAQMESLENVHTEPAKIPHWIRGHESASLVSPRKAKINVLGLGYSVGTPQGGIIADVVAVRTFGELHDMPDEEVKGKIVVFAPEWAGYGSTVAYRSKGATEASKKGAIATLIRSATPFSIGSPHTGMQSYGPGVRKIPTACITVEDAEMILRLYRAGEPVRIRLEMEDYNLEPVMSRNTIAELQGSTSPNKSVVVVSGHLDSWDVGVGAMDDGGGAFISLKALKFLKLLNLRPKRTIRAILWTAEEMGLIGAEEYYKAHKANEKEEFNFFIESDIGTFNPLGFDFSGNKKAECIFKEILKLMAPLNATQFASPVDGGPDISKWVNRGFPGASLMNQNEHYFWFHHSDGDSMLLESADNLDRCVALFAALSYVIADLSVDMPRTLI